MKDVKKSMKMTEKGTCKLGRLCRVEYFPTNHDIGGILWWISKGKFRSHVSRGTMKDFHYRLVRKIDRVESDDVWKGRFHNGVVTVMPPISTYVKDDFNKVPSQIVKIIRENLKADAILICSKNGMRVLEESKK